MSDQKGPSNKVSGTPDPNRRRLLKGGVGAAPLLTLVSRPVLGDGLPGQCFTPSGFVSMPTSQPGNPIICRGLTPGYWKQTQHFDQWPSPYRPVAVAGPGGGPATMFAEVFTPPGPYQKMSLLDVLNQGSGPPHNVGRHIVAALLNAAKGLSTVLTVPQIKGIWSQYITVDYFEPTAGVKWDHNQITAYLESTMPV